MGSKLLNTPRTQHFKLGVLEMGYVLLSTLCVWVDLISNADFNDRSVTAGFK
jgi:hypothetical protein